MARGMPEGLPVERNAVYDVTLLDVLQAYGDMERRKNYQEFRLREYNLVSLDEAYERLSTMLGQIKRKGRARDWAQLDQFLPDAEDLRDALMARSAVASTLTACLEMAKQGTAELRQDGAFKPVYVRGAGAG